MGVGHYAVVFVDFRVHHVNGVPVRLRDRRNLTGAILDLFTNEVVEDVGDHVFMLITECEPACASVDTNTILHVGVVVSDIQ